MSPRASIAAAFTLTVALSAAPATAATLYAGSWFNDTFGASGPAQASVDISAPNVTLTFDLDNGPGGIVFGQPIDPDPVTVQGTLNPDTSVTVTDITPNPHHVYGDIAATIVSPANVTIEMTNIPALNIDSATMTGGQNSPSTMHFDYVVRFPPGAGNPAVGRVELTLVPEPAAGPAIAGALIGLCGLARRRRRRRW